MTVFKGSRRSRLYRLPLVAVGLVVLTLVACAAGGEPSASVQKPAPRFVLMVSSSPDRADATPLQGQTVKGVAWVFVTPSKGFRGVRYVVDGKPLGNRNGFQTTRLGHGPHVVTATVTVDARRKVTVRARFRAEHLIVRPPSSAELPTCVVPRPCLTLDRAYHAAAPGQIVEIAAGDYGDQELNVDGSKTGPAKVIFRPSPGAAPRLGEISVHGAHVEFQDLRVAGWKTLERAANVTFRNVATTAMYIWSSSNVSVIGGSVGPNPATSFDSSISTASGSQKPPTNILIDGVRFHDWIDVDPNQSNHIECLQIGAGVNVTIRRSRFQRCGTHDILVRSWGNINGGYHPLQNWVIENNVFDKTTHGTASVVFIADLDPAHCTNILFRNNSARQYMRAENCSNVRWIGNLAERPAFAECVGVFSHNVWYASWTTPAKCGPTDRRLRRADPGYVNGDALDLRLRPRSPAINRGDPRSYPRTDINGQRRPKGRAPDAGAHETG